MSELKNCPFCGSNKVGCYEAWTHYACQCDECGATMVKRGTEQEAINAWNTRTERTCELEKVHEWGDEWEPFGYVCKSCEEALPRYYGSDRFGNVITPNYCPNCGAKVIGSSEYEQGSSSAKVVE